MQPGTSNSILRHNVAAKLRIQSSGDVETKQLNGRDHLVFPAIILVEGVLWSSNAPHPALALSEEFGIFPSGWDGRPVFYGHPKIDNQAVSGNLPEFWDNGKVIGQLFSSDMATSNKLRSQVWLDKEKTPTEILQALEDGEELEVSTGLFALEEEKAGIFNGEKYKVIWRNIVPDHLAILPSGTKGACSIEDGCGAPRANESTKGDNVTTATTAPAQPTQNSSSDAGTSTKVQPATNAQPATQASPGEAQPAASTTPAVQPATSSEPKANCDCQGKPTVNVNVNTNTNTDKGVLANFRKNARKMFDDFMKGMGLLTNELSDTDVRAAVQAALDAYIENSEYTYGYLVAIFPSKAVCMLMDKDYVFQLMQVSYAVAEGGAVTLGADYEAVRPETQYVPLVINEAKAKNASGEQPKGNEMTQATPAAAPAEPTHTHIQPTAGAQASAQQAPKASSLKDLMAYADDTTKSQLEALIRANTERQATLVNSLKDKVGLSEDELKAMPIASLEKMAAKLNQAPATAAPATAATAAQPAAQPQADFSASAPAAPSANASNAEDFTPPTPVFDFNKPSAAAK